MPIVPAAQTARIMGKVESPFCTSLLALPIPIVPLSYLLNAVVIGNKGVIGTYKRVYTRKELWPWERNIGTKDFMREKKTEKKLVQAVKSAGGIAVKFVSPGYDGMPDRLVLLPGGKMGFVEVKSMGCKPRPLQERRHEMLRGLGFLVYVLDDENQIGGILDEIRTT